LLWFCGGPQTFEAFTNSVKHREKMPNLDKLFSMICLEEKLVAQARGVGNTEQPGKCWQVCFVIIVSKFCLFLSKNVSRKLLSRSRLICQIGDSIGECNLNFKLVVMLFSHFLIF
jgi:hypothetical protein